VRKRRGDYTQQPVKIQFIPAKLPGHGHGHGSPEPLPQTVRGRIALTFTAKMVKSSPWCQERKELAETYAGFGLLTR
jgi:hypothetical protein